MTPDSEYRITELRGYRIPATLLFVSISGCTVEIAHSLRSAAPRLRRHPQIKYGACRDIRRTLSEGGDFCDYHLVRTRLKNFVKVPDRQVFALMQKTDCLNREAVSLTFSVSFLAKFCEFQNLRSDDLRHIQRISSQKFIL